jgi:hypothetical protein
MKRGADGLTDKTVALLCYFERDRPRFADGLTGRDMHVQAGILLRRGFVRRVACEENGKTGTGFQLTEAGAQLKAAAMAKPARRQ